MEGKFIVFEGINSCGKTEIKNRIYHRMISENYQVETREEPSHDTPIGKMTRELYLSGKRYHDPIILGHLISIDRYENTVDPNFGTYWKLQKGINILQSRNYISTCALNCMGNTLSIEDCARLNEITTNILQPDLVLFLDIDYKTAKERLSKYKYHDVHEKDEDLKLKDLIDSYKKAVDFLQYRDKLDIAIVNAKLSINDVEEICWNLIEPILKKEE